MIAKLAVTTRCNARCKTCPVWTIPGGDMPLDGFRTVWDKLMLHPAINKVLINSTGDLYNHPRRAEIMNYIDGHITKMVSMTTNGALMDRVPRIPEVIISFNGASKEGYEYTTGLPFAETVARIKSFYPALRELHNCEIHCLVWEGNNEPDLEQNLLAIWGDFPGRVRVSYKYDNQFGKNRGILDPGVRGPRVYCDYLDMLVVGPDGTVAQCSHDFHFENQWGNLFAEDLEDVLFHPARMRKQREHAANVFKGLCERCDYNVPDSGLVRYLK